MTGRSAGPHRAAALRAGPGDALPPGCPLGAGRAQRCVPVHV